MSQGFTVLPKLDGNLDEWKNKGLQITYEPIMKGVYFYEEKEESDRVYLYH